MPRQGSAEVLEFVILIFLIQCVAATCLAHLRRFPDRGFRDVIPYLRPDHQAELEDLLDPAIEENLADALGRRRFRKEQLKRIHLAQECVAQRTHNARVFQEWGSTECEKAIKNLNCEAGENAKALIDACLDYRAHACMIQGALYTWYFSTALLPFIRVPRISSLRRTDSFDLIDSYATVEEAAEHLALACGGECRHVLIRTLHTAREGATDAAWISEAKMARGRS